MSSVSQDTASEAVETPIATVEPAADQPANGVIQAVSDTGTFRINDALRSGRERHGRTPWSQLKEIMGLNMGPGGMPPQEYFYYQLMDERYSPEERRAFLGQDRYFELVSVTYECDREILAATFDKLLTYRILNQAGFRHPETVAHYGARNDLDGIEMFEDAAAMAESLRTRTDYPLFGKPLDSFQSLGVASLDGYDAGTDELRLQFGGRVGVEAFVAEIEQFKKDGYLFQRRLSPHPDVEAIVGDRIATLRLVVFDRAGGPEMWRAAWKLPAGFSVADNFWRGNVLAAIDVASGAITRAVLGCGPALEEITHHPDSGQPLVGAVVPYWQEAVELALKATPAFTGFDMKAWDIAILPDGPMAIEANNYGAPQLVQLAHARGALDDPFKRFLRECAEKRGMQRKLRRYRV